MSRIDSALLLLASAGMLGCGGGDQPRSAGDTGVAATGAPAMPPAGMEVPSGGMMAQMEAQMERMAELSRDSLVVALPEHRRRLASLIAQMDREMRGMEMTADSAWEATVDSLRADLRRLPELSADALESALSGHRERVSRLLAEHRRMMRDMGR